MRAPKLFAATMGGQKIELDWTAEGRSTLLFVFSPSCVWCKRNAKNMQALAAARRADLRVVGLATTSEGLSEYIKEQGIDYTVYKNPDPDKSREYLASGTPTTFVVSSDRTIKRIWRGAYVGNIKDEIEASLGVRLPGVVEVGLEAVHVR